MRVRGPYGGDAGSGRDRGRDAEARKREFRRRHARGDRVQGIVLRWESEGLAWVRVAGQELLAAIRTTASPGDQLLFLVRNLEPEIELQELGFARSGSASALLRGFFAARSRLDAFSSRLGPLHGETSQARRREWLAAAGRQPEALAGLARTLLALEPLNLALAARGGGRIVYAPWLAPGARGFELVVEPSEDFVEAAAGLELPGLGRFELRLLAQSDVVRFRALAERPESVAAAAEALRPMARELAGLGAENLGAGLLPPGPGPAQRLAQSLDGGPVHGRLNARV